MPMTIASSRTLRIHRCQPRAAAALAAAALATAVLLSAAACCAAEPEPQGPGEDLGQQSASVLQQEIETIHRRMQRAEALLSQRQTANETQRLQRDTLEGLRRLIRELEPQGDSPSPAGSPDGPKGSDPDRPRETPGAAPAGAPVAALSGDAAAAGQRVWGHLPPQLRQRMRSAGIEEFLPQYEAMLESYYKRLAESPLLGP